MKNFWLAVHPTNICSRSCQGCYINYWITNRPDNMSKKTSKKVIDWTLKFCKNSKVENFCMAFLGGEPSIRLEFCLEMMKSVHSKLKDIVKPYYGSWFMFFTNGDFLTSKALEEMSFYNTIVLYNPTYDSLNDIDDKLKFIKSRIKLCCISVILNEYNLARVIDLAKLAVENKVNLRLNPLYYPTLEYIESLYKPLDGLFDYLLSLKDEELIWPKLLIGSLYVGWSNRFVSPYSYGNWLLVVDTDGSIRICSADDSTLVGSLSTISSIKDVVFNHSWDAKSIDACQKCEWLSWCHGGHPLTRSSFYFSYDYPTPYCGLYKKIFPKWKILLDKWESKKHVEMHM